MSEQGPVKPCPFCGNVGVTVREGSTFRWRAAECNACGARAGEVRMQTSGDGYWEEWIAEAMKDAISAWNERA